MALSPAEGAFRIDVYDVTGTTKLGVIMTAISVGRTRSLNEVGAASFTLPTLDPISANIQLGRRYRIYHDQDGFLGEYIHRDYTTDTGSGNPITTVNADATLKLLANKMAKFNRSIQQPAGLAAQAIVNAANEVDPYLGAPTPWSCDIYDSTPSTLGDITLDIQGQSVLSALDTARKMVRANFRQTATYKVQFGTFSNITQSQYGVLKYAAGKYFGNVVGGVVYNASNVEQVTPELETSTTSIVTACKVVQSATKIVNRLVVLGAGDALNQLTMQATYDSYASHKPDDAGAFTYVVKRNANPDGTGVVYFCNILTGGVGYGVNTPPTVVFSGGGATTQATGHAIVSGGVLIAIVVDTQGIGYTSQPSIGLSGGDASVQGTAEAYINSYYYYIEDQTSIATYGLYEEVMVKGDIRPLTNSTRQMLYASDALYFVGATYLTAYKDPQTVYDIKIVNLPAAVDVGTALHFRYRGLADLDGTITKYLDVDSTMSILSINETWADGNKDVTLTISSNGQAATDTIDVVLGSLQQMNAAQVQVRPYPSREIINKERQIDVNHDAVFDFNIADETLFIIGSDLQFVTRPFRSTINPNLTVPLTDIFAGETSLYPYDLTTNFSDAIGYTDTSHQHQLLYSPGDYHYNDGVTKELMYNQYNVIPDPNVSPVRPRVYLTIDQNGIVGYRALNAYGSPLPDWGLLISMTGLKVQSHSHSSKIPQHKHSAGGKVDFSRVTLTMGIYDDLDASQNIPSGLSLYLDGTFIGGGWTAGNNVQRKVDLLSALKTTSVLRGPHTLTFHCTSGRGLVEVSFRLLVALQATIKTVSYGGA